MSFQLRPLIKTDLPLKYTLLSKVCSYNELHSTFGYSRTEIEIEYEQVHDFSEYLFESSQGEPIGLVRVGPPDLISGVVSVQPVILVNNADWTSIFSEGLAQLVASLGIRHNISRMFSFLLIDETEEAEILRKNGFDLEAVLKRHLYFSGAYHDLLVFGTLRRDA